MKNIQVQHTVPWIVYMVLIYLGKIFFPQEGLLVSTLWWKTLVEGRSTFTQTGKPEAEADLWRPCH